ncbi:hypothetical protein ACQP1O_10930 [Nocardia sp. CA-151230]|uniref:hypothetical protein n=1 Tax=Nocardia sp. CA-151230 TaxID=3239982 RepID=UPI003D945988
MLFALAAVAEIGGAWPIWQGGRENRGFALDRGRHHRPGPVRVHRHPATDANFGALAAYGGVVRRRESR